MELAGEQVLAATPEQVDAALNDREAVARLVPAAAGFTPCADGVFAGRLVVGRPPLGRAYPAELRVRREAGGGLRLLLTGRQGAAELRLEAECQLACGPRPGTTLLRYALRGELGGLGGLLGAASARLVQDFLRGLEREAAAAGRWTPGSMRP